MSQFRQAQTPYGVMTGFEDDLILRFLTRFGEWAPFESVIARTLLQAGDTIVDAGAFIGTFSLSLVASQPARIIAVEANPSTFEALHHNCMTLAPDIVVPLHGALGVVPGQNGAPSAPVFDSANRGAATFATTGTAAEDAPTVPAITLPGIREHFGDYNLGKFDLEGFELATLKADAYYLETAKPVILVGANETPQSAQVANFLRSVGYETHYASLPVWRRHNPKAAIEPVFPLAHEGLLLACAPGTVPDTPPELRANGGSLTRVEDTTQLIEAFWKTPLYATQDWASMSREELIGVIGRLHKGETRADFQTRLYPTDPLG